MRQVEADESGNGGKSTSRNVKEKRQEIEKKGREALRQIKTRMDGK